MIKDQALLLVEDDYFIAEDLCRSLQEYGVRVLGPVSTIGDALRLIESTSCIDAAVLDINLHGELVYPVADALKIRNVPFVFSSGYDAAVVPPRFRQIRHCEKPGRADSIAKALLD